MTFCCLLGNNIDCASHFTGWQLIRLLQVFESVATQWVVTTVSWANLSWLFLLGSCPVRCLLCCPLDGETQIWLGDLRLACVFWFVVCVLVVMICPAACDHLCPCRSFLNSSFFSCKDRALERDRPYPRKKKLLAGRGLVSAIFEAFCLFALCFPGRHARLGAGNRRHQGPYSGRVYPQEGRGWGSWMGRPT